MASTIILSDNGASSGSAGLKQTAGNDGVLILQTTTSGGTATNAIYVDTSQNVGVGVTPSGWDTAVRKGLQLGLGGVYESDTRSAYLGNTSFGGNYYYSSGWKYIGTDYASRIEFRNDSGNAGAVVISGSASGTAGNAITWSDLLTLKKDNTVALQGATQSSGTGIAFPATQSASSDANTLDDYEEGTWTPAFSPTGTSFTSISYSVQSAFYTKIGNVVTVWFGVVINTVTVGSASGNLYVTGLPFNVYSSAAAYSQGNADAGTFLNNQPSVLIALQNSSYIGTFYRSSSNGALINQPATNAQNGAYVYGSLTYRTST